MVDELACDIELAYCCCSHLRHVAGQAASESSCLHLVPYALVICICSRIHAKCSGADVT